MVGTATVPTKSGPNRPTIRRRSAAGRPPPGGQAGPPGAGRHELYVRFGPTRRAAATSTAEVGIKELIDNALGATEALGPPSVEVEVTCPRAAPATAR
jgi:hypothetical protein